MREFLELTQEVLTNGEEKTDRTGVGTFAIFGDYREYDLSKGFPLNWTKQTSFHNIKTELLWFLGNHMEEDPYISLPQTNVKYLVDNNVNIWNDWPYQEYKEFYVESGMTGKSEVQDDFLDFSDLNLISGTYQLLTPTEFRDRIKESTNFAERWGNLGPIYGKQWRHWNRYDQIKNAIKAIKNNPTDRGILVSAWNVSQLHEMALRPCHVLFQFSVNNGKLDLMLYQRSCDLFLGWAYNVAEYSLLLSLIAQVTGYEPGYFKHVIGDLHIYKNHLDQVEQVKKTVEAGGDLQLGNLGLDPNVKQIENFNLNNIKLTGYKSHKAVRGPVAV